MIETAVLALTSFFATIGPFDAAVMFAALTADESPAQKRLTAIRGIIISAVILLTFALAGEIILSNLGVSLPAFRTAGGILLLLISIDMVFARSSGGNSTTDEEEEEALSKSDVSVFPLATPLIAGPGAMGVAILLMTDQQGNIAGQIAIIVSILLILLLTFFSMLAAGKIQHLLGVTGMQVITRVMGVLLSALSVQFIFDGIKQSGLF